MFRYLNHPLKHVGKWQVRDRHILLLDHKRALRRGTREKISRALGRDKAQAAANVGVSQEIKHAVWLFQQHLGSRIFIQGQLGKVPRSDRGNQTAN